MPFQLKHLLYSGIYLFLFSGLVTMCVSLMCKKISLSSVLRINDMRLIGRKDLAVLCSSLPGFGINER